MKMILSTESCMLHKAVGDRRSIEIIAQAGFDAVDYTFTPYMEDDDPQWQGSSLPATARTLKLPKKPFRAPARLC